MIGTREVEGFSALTLASPAAGGIEVAFVPEAGMVGCSLRQGGHELLGQRGGLRTYVRERSTMGIPLLHPWANRVAERRFPVAGREVDLDKAPHPVAVDQNGLPIHGLLAAAKGWAVERHQESAAGGLLEGSFDFAADQGLLAAFPFPHELRIEAVLSGPALTLSTTVRASGDTAVPVSFGYHPYFQLPGVARSAWELELPVSEGIELDSLYLPTGRRKPATVEPGPLGGRTFDDSYVVSDPGAPFAISGGGRRIEVRFGSGYPVARVYAPDDDDVVALEPMTAPTNTLVTGGDELTLLEPGESYEAIFSVTVS